MVGCLGSARAIQKMIKCLAFSLLMTLMAASGLPDATQRLDGHLIRVGLDDDPRATPAPTATPAPADSTASSDPASCAGATFTRSLKYGGEAMNVLDLASGQTKSGGNRPVLAVVARDDLAGGRDSPTEEP